MSRLALLLAAVAAWAAPDTPGQRLYIGQCAMCHGEKGEGGRGPTLARAKLHQAPDDAALARIIRTGLPGTGMPGTFLIDAEVREIVAYVRSLGRVTAAKPPGDAQAGARYFASGGCAACHAIGGTGSIFGPALDGIGARRSASHLRQSLLDPNADVPPGYATIRATTNDGRRLTGIRVNEDTFSVQLRDATGKVHSLWKSSLKAYESTNRQSLMPSYRGKLTEVELTDLVAYLAGLEDAR